MILSSKILTIKGYRSAFVKYKPTKALLFYYIKKPVNEFIKTHLLAILLGIISQPLNNFNSLKNYFFSFPFGPDLYSYLPGFTFLKSGFL